MRKFKNIGRIKVFLKDPNKKSMLKMAKEVLVLMAVKKEIPYYYFKYLYRKKVTNYLDYISTGELNKIGNNKKLHKPEYYTIIENKLFFSLFCEQVSLKTPALISYNLGSSFFFNHAVHVINNKEELNRFFNMLFTTTNDDALFFRPPSEYGGKGCFKLTKANLSNELNKYYDLLVNGCFTHTKMIIQHEELNKIHSNAVSTLRIISLITSDNNIEIISAFIRFGVGESVVDNSSSGGFWVGVNMSDGTLKEIGHYMSEYGGAEIKEHPDSGFKFGGFKVPFFKEACDEIVKAVKIIPDRFIGWDVAITPEGPIIVEANTGPHLPSVDIGYGGLLKNTHIRKLIDELNNNVI